MVRRVVVAVAAAALAVEQSAAMGVLHLHQEAYPDNLQPPLEDVKSDKKFYGPPFPADYPHDQQPKLPNDMLSAKGSPTYPHLKDSHDLESDYVKDDNGDSGEWAAQLSYDRARVRIAKEEVAVKKLKEAAEKQEQEAKAAEKLAKDAQAQEEAAKKAQDAAQEQVKEAEATEKAAEQAAQEAGEAKKKAEAENKEKSAKAEQQAASKEELVKQLDTATKKLEEQKVAFKKCEEELANAKAEVERLKGLVAQAAVAVSLPTANGTVAVHVDHSQSVKLAQSRAAAAHAKLEAAKASLAAAQANREKLEVQLSREKRQHTEAAAALEKETAEYNKVSEELTAAQARLRKPVRGIKAAAVGPAVSALTACAALVALAWSL